MLYFTKVSFGQINILMWVRKVNEERIIVCVRKTPVRMTGVVKGLLLGI